MALLLTQHELAALTESPAEIARAVDAWAHGWAAARGISHSFRLGCDPEGPA
jgi:hypothetical protein